MRIFCCVLMLLVSFFIISVSVFAKEMNTVATKTGVSAAVQAAATLENPLDKIAALQNSFVVMELYTSQACVFCPKADAFIKDFITLDHVIALSCHVDYFDVKVGSLSLPECGKRQEMFESSLRQGPKFTPQLIINGEKSAVGYRQADVWRILDEAIATPVKAGTILPAQEKDGFDLTLPEVEAKNLDIKLLTFDRVKTVKVVDGGNKGKSMTYYNVVSSITNLGKWGGEAKNIDFSAVNTPERAGLVVFGQDSVSGKIFAAAQYNFPEIAK